MLAILFYYWWQIQAAIFIPHAQMFIFLISASWNANGNVNFIKWSFHISNITNVLGSLSPSTKYLELLLEVTQSKHTSGLGSIILFIFFLPFCRYGKMCADLQFLSFFYANIKPLWIRNTKINTFKPLSHLPTIFSSALFSFCSGKRQHLHGCVPDCWLVSWFVLMNIKWAKSRSTRNQIIKRWKKALSIFCSPSIWQPLLTTFAHNTRKPGRPEPDTQKLPPFSCFRLLRQRPVASPAAPPTQRDKPLPLMRGSVGKAVGSEAWTWPVAQLDSSTEPGALCVRGHLSTDGLVLFFFCRV